MDNSSDVSITAWARSCNTDNGKGNGEVCSHALRHAYIKTQCIKDCLNFDFAHLIKYAEKRRLQSGLTNAHRKRSLRSTLPTLHMPMHMQPSFCLPCLGCPIILKHCSASCMSCPVLPISMESAKSSYVILIGQVHMQTSSGASCPMIITLWPPQIPLYNSLGILVNDLGLSALCWKLLSQCVLGLTAQKA